MTEETVTIGTGDLIAEVSPKGAETQRLVSRGADLLWGGDRAWWGGRAPVLFPIVGRAEGDRIAVDGRVAEMKQHGFARRATFARAASGQDFVAFELTPDDAMRAAYPFDFRLTLTHRIEGATLTVTARVANEGDRPMPFGFGFHPAFVWPLPGAAPDAAHEIILDNGGEPALTRLEGGFITDRRLPSPFAKGRLALAHDQFVEDAMIFPEGAGDGLTYRAEGAPALRFRFVNLPNLALWQKPGAPYVCVEPWHGMAGALGRGPEIAARPYSQTLAPGAAAEFAFSVTVD